MGATDVNLRLADICANCVHWRTGENLSVGTCAPQREAGRQGSTTLGMVCAAFEMAPPTECGARMLRLFARMLPAEEGAPFRAFLVRVADLYEGEGEPRG